MILVENPILTNRSGTAGSVIPVRRGQVGGLSNEHLGRLLACSLRESKTVGSSPGPDPSLFNKEDRSLRAFLEGSMIRLNKDSRSAEKPLKARNHAKIQTIKAKHSKKIEPHRHASNTAI